MRLWLLAAALAFTGCSDEPAPVALPDPQLPLETAEADPTLVAIDLGVHAVGADVVFDVPDETLGATVVGRAHGDFGFESLTAGDVQVVEDYGFDGFERFVSVRPRVGERETSMLAMALPQSDTALPLVAGRNRLLLGAAGDEPAAEVALTLWLRQADAPRGAFEVRVFLAPGVAEQSYLEQVVAQALEGFAGLALGGVTFHTLPDEARVIDDDAELLAILAMTAGQEGAPFVNVIATSDMSGMLGSPVGRAGGIPAIGAEHGTELSGLAFEVSGELGRDAQVVRHEVGHLAGLFHTTDAFGVDPLADTPVCADVDAGGCPDEENAMFPRYSAVRGALSATQKRIVLGSTLYRATRGQPHQGGTDATSEISPDVAVRLPVGLEELDAICGLDPARITASAEELLAFARDPRFSTYLRKRARLVARVVAELELGCARASDVPENAEKESTCGPEGGNN